MKKIFIIGQCTMHWGRMEFGNIGNYYIVEPMFEQIRRVFPYDEIATTMQFTDSFCDRFGIKTVPMELYYDFKSDKNLEAATEEYDLVKNHSSKTTLFIDEVKKSDMVIDFSGDIWGDNADFLGTDRFLTGCYKDLTAQQIKPTVMLAGSPGPFNKQKDIDFVKKVYEGFVFVTNREPVSTRLLAKQGFNLCNTYDYPCPSFLFKKADDAKIKETIPVLKCNEEIKIGLILCGWNFKYGPFDKWPRADEEYDNFIKLIQYVLDKYPAHIFLLSHSNGFDVPPKPFAMKHGRDFPIMEQVYKLLLNNTGYSSKVTLLDGIYVPDQTKAIVSHFDVLISGRMHGAVAGLSQNIPTLIIDYGHEPIAHKLRGFAEVIGDDSIIADPNNLNDLKAKVMRIIENRNLISTALSDKTVLIKQNSKAQFDKLRDYVQ